MSRMSPITSMFVGMMMLLSMVDGIKDEQKSASVSDGEHDKTMDGKRNATASDAEMYAQKVFNSYQEYWNQWSSCDDPNMRFVKDLLFSCPNKCPKDMRVLLADDKDNFIVLVGESHGENMGCPVLSPSAKTFVAAMDTEEPSIRRVAAIELPILKGEKEVQLLWKDGDKKVPLAFQKELNPSFTGTQNVVASGAGRTESWWNDEMELSSLDPSWTNDKMVLNSLSPGHSDTASINHAIFESGTSVEIKAGEPPDAYLQGAKTEDRNRNAATRLNALAKEVNEKPTVVVFSYGMTHLCDGSSLASVQTVLKKKHGWKCLDGCASGCTDQEYPQVQLPSDLDLLEEMGYNNREINRDILGAPGGSIQTVVDFWTSPG